MDAPYQPTSRRPIAQRFRATAGGAVRLCVRLGIHPDVISYASVGAAAVAGVCFWLAGRWAVLLLVAPLLCYARLWLNMLDGMVALAAGKASRRGEILNDLPDRISDILIFAGVAHSGLCNPLAAYWAMVMALLSAYVGTLGQAVGAGRQFGGVMSKPWRMVGLHLGAWVTFALIYLGRGGWRVWSLTVLDLTCLLIVGGCMQTICARLARIMTALRANARDS